MGENQQTVTSSTAFNPVLMFGGMHALAGATQLYNQKAELPSTYTGISDERQQALEMMRSRAQSGSPEVQAALGEYGKVMGGDYLDSGSNPYMQDIVNRSVGQSMRPVVGGFAQGGRFGSGAHANAVTDTAQATASRLYGDQYNRERSYMQNALQMAPQMEALGYQDAARLGFVGSQFEQDQSNRQQEAVRQTMWPYQQQALYEASLANSPLVSNTATNQTSSQPFDWGGMVSGILNPVGGMLGGE